MCAGSFNNASAYGRVVLALYPKKDMFQIPNNPMITGMLSLRGVLMKCSSMERAPCDDIFGCM